MPEAKERSEAPESPEGRIDSIEANWLVYNIGDRVAFHDAHAWQDHVADWTIRRFIRDGEEYLVVIATPWGEITVPSYHVFEKAEQPSQSKQPSQ